jgi:hypothetical protein
LIEQFGHSGLGRYEAQLAAEDEKAAAKAIDITPPRGSVEPMRSGFSST